MKKINIQTTLLFLVILFVESAFGVNVTQEEPVLINGTDYTLEVSNIRIDYELEELDIPQNGATHSAKCEYSFDIDFKGEYSRLVMAVLYPGRRLPSKYGLSTNDVWYSGTFRSPTGVHVDVRTVCTLWRYDTSNNRTDVFQFSPMDYLAPEDRVLILYDDEKGTTSIDAPRSKEPEVHYVDDALLICGIEPAYSNLVLSDLRGCRYDIQESGIIISDEVFQIPLNSVPKGIYILLIKSKNKIYHYKIIRN